MSFCSRTSSSQSPHDRRVKLFETSHQAIGYEWGCLSYLSGVKIGDLVPFTMSQTLVDYRRPSWYLLGCFTLDKIPEISITWTILMIWPEPLEHIDKGVFILRIFQFFCLNWYFLGVDINCCHSHTDKTQVPFIILKESFSKFPARILALFWGSSEGADTCSTLSKDKFWCDFRWREKSFVSKSPCQHVRWNAYTTDQLAKSVCSLSIQLTFENILWLPPAKESLIDLDM